MENICLKAKEEKALKRLHRKSRDLQTGDRIKAILHHSSGWQLGQISEALLLDSSTVRRYINEYHMSKKLKHDRRGGSSGNLTEAQ